jgi:hypothetical protein
VAPAGHASGRQDQNSSRQARSVKCGSCYRSGGILFSRQPLVSLVLIYASYSLSRTAAALSHPNKQIQPTPKNGAADLQHWTDR